jgi:large subunit ribosomal protein L29
MKTKELHAMSVPDLQKQLKSSRQELFNLRFQMATGQLANHRQIRNVRRALAQILTEMQEKEEQQQEVQGEAPTTAEASAPRRRSRTPATAAAVARSQAESEPEAETKPRRSRRSKPASPADEAE